MARYSLGLAFGMGAVACGRVAGSSDHPGVDVVDAADAMAGTSAASDAGAGFGGEGGTTAGEVAGASGNGDNGEAGPRPLSLLTQRQYQNTVRDLLGGGTLSLPSLPADEQDFSAGFPFHGTGAVTQPSALQYRAAAEAVSQAALTNIAAWLPCAATAGSSAAAETACLATFFAANGFATKVYRRPLSTTAITGEVARLTALYQAARQTEPASEDISASVGLVLEAMLQTPEFMYHWEVDTGPSSSEGNVVKLGNYEIANRLSYMLWGSMPDTALFAAAAEGQLAVLSGVEAQVRRMLKDPRAADSFADFFVDWLDLDTPIAAKDPVAYPQYSAALVQAMTTEARRFVTSVVVEGTAHFDEILTGTSSFANQDLAKLYGVSGVTGTALGPVSLDPAQRSGLFTTGAFLSSTAEPAVSDPTRRGSALYQRLLCQPLAPSPAMTALGPPAPGDGTTRQRFDRVGAMACAVPCHARIDPWGFAFEHYDAIGAYRTLDNGAAVDASVTVTLDGAARSVKGAPELLAAMAMSDEVQTCFARQWLRYGLGRLDAAQDRASLESIVRAFKQSRLDIRELVVAVATSRTFRFRTPGSGEVLQ